jgi:hypothetical protein
VVGEYTEEGALGYVYDIVDFAPMDHKHYFPSVEGDLDMAGAEAKSVEAAGVKVQPDFVYV